jgi:hypothetical protein
MTPGGGTLEGRAIDVACTRKNSRNDRLTTGHDRLTMLDSTSFTNHAR